MTVSNAFSRPRQLSAELRAQILAVASELGYVGPDPAARSLARGTTGAVGVLLTDSLGYAFTDEVATGFLGAFAEELAATGLALTLLTADQHQEVIPARDVPMDGALVYSCRPESDAREWLLRRGLPVVFVDQEPVAGITSVNVDDRGGARAAAQHVVDLGHRHVGLLMVSVDGLSGPVVDPLAEVRGHPQRQRVLGWLDILNETGIHPRAIQASGNTDAEADAAAALLLDTDARPTAVLCFSDVLALGVIRVVERLGLAVPDDVSVVGFDDTTAARRVTPQLTTVHQDVAAKGRLAASALTATIEHARIGTKPRVRHRTLPTELIQRQSTGSPPGA